MLMKKLFFLFMMLAMGMYAQAQQLDVCTKPYGDDGSEITVIKPTVANFLQLLSMTEEQFKQMKEDEDLEKARKSLTGAMVQMLGIRPKMHLLPPKSIVRSEGKAVRAVDKRKLHD